MAHVSVPPEAPIVAIVVGLLLAAVVIAYIVNRHRAHKAFEECLAALSRESDEFVAQARRGLTPIATRLILKDGEDAVLEEASALFEPRGSGGGSGQRRKHIDEGTLTLTTRRLIFDGAHENRNIQLSQVLSVRPWLDVIEVSTERRAKNQIYRVKNPFIWTSAIEGIAAGKISERRKIDSA